MENIKNKLGYDYHQEIKSIETTIRKNNPVATDAEVYFASIRTYEENHANDPSLKERQKQRKVTVKSIPSFTKEELQYIADRLAWVNEPIGQEILDKIGKMI